jgi:hypothetical protein
LGLRYDVSLLAGDGVPDDAPGLHASPLLTGSEEPMDFRFKLAAPLTCLSTDTAVTGRSASGSVGTDHPGGQILIPGGDFRGGRSGLIGEIHLSPSITFEDPQVGIIGDTNRNGAVDGSDSMHRAVSASGADDGGIQFVVPLFDYGDYFLFVFDGTDFSIEPPERTSVGGALSDLGDAYQGDGRFETSIGLLGSGGLPFVYSVGPGEGSEDIDGELLIFVTAQLVDGD